MGGPSPMYIGQYYTTRPFWEELNDVGSYWDRPWCIGGDLNAGRTRTKRKCMRSSKKDISFFCEFVHGFILVEFIGEGAFHFQILDRKME